MCLAILPFPVPHSPMSSTVAPSLFARRSICSASSRIAGDDPSSALVAAQSRRLAMRRTFAINTRPPPWAAWARWSSGIPRHQEQRRVRFAVELHGSIAEELAVGLEEACRRGLDPDTMPAGIERRVVGHEMLSRQAPHDAEGIAEVPRRKDARVQHAVVGANAGTEHDALA